MKIIWIFVFIVFFGFALKNNQTVTLQFFWGYEQSGPLVILLLVFFLFGAILCLFAMLPMIFKMKLTISRNKKSINSLETEIELLKQGTSTTMIADAIKTNN
jgi:putative membrane protein